VRLKRRRNMINGKQVGVITKNSDISTSKSFILSLQHFIAMFGSTVLVPLITGLDPLVSIFAAGVGTIIFHICTGFKVPVFLGSSFAFIAPITLIASVKGDLAYANGAIFVSGLVYLLFALLIKIAGYNFFRKVFPPVITGTMIVIIGLTLSPTAVSMASSNWLLSIPTLLTVIIFSTFFKGFFSMIPVLMGVIVGYAVSLISGNIDFTALHSAAWLSVPNFNLPKFDFWSISVTVPLVLATFMEHIGDITTNGAVVGKDFTKDPGLHRTLMGDGLATAFAGLIGGPANTTYSENTGVLALTKVYNPSILRNAAFIAIILSFVSKFGAILSSIPQAVIGGISIVLFGMIASVGIRTLINEKINLNISKNLIIVSVMLVCGIGGASIKIGSVEFKGVALAAIIGIILNLLIPSFEKDNK